MRSIVTDVWRGVSVCLRVRHEMAPCENQTAGAIEMPFGTWGGVGPSNQVIDGGSELPRKGAIWGDFQPIE